MRRFGKKGQTDSATAGQAQTQNLSNVSNLFKGQEIKTIDLLIGPE